MIVFLTVLEVEVHALSRNIFKRARIMQTGEAIGVSMETDTVAMWLQQVMTGSVRDIYPRTRRYISPGHRDRYSSHVVTACNDRQ